MPGRIDNTESAMDRRHSEMSASANIPRPDVGRSPSSPSYLHHHNAYHHPHRPGSSRLQSFSLIGALEFRNIVHNLQRDSGAAGLKAFDNNMPVTPTYAGGRYHPHRRSSRDSGRHRHWDGDLELNRPPSTSPRRLSSSDPSTGLLAVDTSTGTYDSGSLHHGDHVESPSISISVPDTILEDGTSTSPPAEDLPTSLSPYPRPSSPSTTVSAFPFSPPPPTSPSRAIRYLAYARKTGHILFPTLVDIRGKSWFRIVASVLAAPAVLLLTLTLPVVITERDIHGGHEDHGEVNGNGNGAWKSNGNGVNGDAEERSESADELMREGHLIDLSTPTVDNSLHPPSATTPSRPKSVASLNSYSTHSSGHSSDAASSIEQLIDDAESEVMHELHGGGIGTDDIIFNKYLTGVQLILGPIFCLSVCFIQMPRVLPWLILAAVISGVSATVLVLVFAKDGTHPVVRLMLCLTGFVVAMVWIMAIADEVVQVLNVRSLLLFF